MHIFVGSTNPVKINCVVNAASETWPDVKVKGFSVVSGIAEQPMSDGETMQGAINRAKAVLKKGLESLEGVKKEKTDVSIKKQSTIKQQPFTIIHQPPSKNVLAVGLEGGVFKKEDGLWSTVWAVVTDPAGNLFSANGARFRVPDIIAKPILAGGEMGPVVSKLFGGVDIKRTNGAIGVITKNFIDRTEEYTAIIKMALGLWYGRDWEAELHHNP